MKDITILTDRLRIDRITLDSTPEVLLECRYFNLEKGKYVPIQVVCWSESFAEVLLKMEARYSLIYGLITSITPSLTAEPYEIGSELIPNGGIVMQDGMFSLFLLDSQKGGLEAYNKSVADIGMMQEGTIGLYEQMDDSCEGEELTEVQGKKILSNSKLDTGRPAYLILDYIPGEITFDPRKLWIREIGDNPKMLPFANQVYMLQLKYRYYLYLRHLEHSPRWAKMIAGIYDPSIFNLARTAYASAANPRKFEN